MTHNHTDDTHDHRDVCFTIDMPYGKTFFRCLPMSDPAKILRIAQELEITPYFGAIIESFHDNNDEMWEVELEETIRHTVMLTAEDEHDAEQRAHHAVSTGSAHYSSESLGDLKVVNIEEPDTGQQG